MSDIADLQEIERLTAELQSACQALQDEQNENERQVKYNANLNEKNLDLSQQLDNRARGELQRESECAKLAAELRKVAEDRNDHWRLCNRYEEQLKIAEDALKQYADDANWRTYMGSLVPHKYWIGRGDHDETAKNALAEIAKRRGE